MSLTLGASHDAPPGARGQPAGEGCADKSTAIRVRPAPITPRPATEHSGSSRQSGGLDWGDRWKATKGITVPGDDLDRVVILVDLLDQREESLACLARGDRHASCPSIVVQERVPLSLVPVLGASHDAPPGARGQPAGEGCADKSTLIRVRPAPITPRPATEHSGSSRQSGGLDWGDSWKATSGRLVP